MQVTNTLKTVKVAAVSELPQIESAVVLEASPDIMPTVPVPELVTPDPSQVTEQ